MAHPRVTDVLTDRLPFCVLPLRLCGLSAASFLFHPYQKRQRLRRMLVLAATLTPLGGPATNALQQGKDLRPRVLLSAGCSHSSEAAKMVRDFLNDLGVPAVLGGVDQRGEHPIRG